LWRETARLNAPGGQAYNRFGCGVAIHESCILVGEAQDSSVAEYAGSVHIFSW